MSNELKRFPFIVKSKHVIVQGSGYRNALDRALMKFPNKYIKTKHAKNMDLINAQKQAKESSKAKKGQLFYVILQEDEFQVKDFMDVKDSDDVYSIWRDGAKIDSPNGSKNNNKTENANKTMETKTKKSPKKVAAKKEKKAATTKPSTAPAKKSAPKKAAKKVKAVKKAVPQAKPDKDGFINPTGRRAFLPGKVVDISVGDMLKNMKKGMYYRDPQGVKQGAPYLSTRPRQDKVRIGMHEYKEDKKA